MKEIYYKKPSLLSRILATLKRDKDRVRDFEQLMKLARDHKSVRVRYAGHANYCIQPASRVIHLPAHMFHRMLKDGIYIYHKKGK